jgi:hypothetical protein
MIITLTEADLRDPMDSEETRCVIEGPIEREADGSCYCFPTSRNDWDGDEIDALLPMHLHLKVSGRKP